MTKFFRAIPQHFKSALKSVWRHLAMSMSASSAVTVTLVLIMFFMLIAGNINSFASNLEDGVQIHVMLETTVDEDGIRNIGNQIYNISNIEAITYSSKEDELELFIDSFGESGEMFAIYRGDSNPMRNAFIVDVEDKLFIDTITTKIRTIEGVESAEFGGSSAVQMIEAFDSIRYIGFAFVLALTLLAIFLISNTIKITIHARANEIGIMRNVGATNWYIRMPFMFEGMFIGILGAILPVVTVLGGYYYFYEAMNGMFFSSMFTLQPVFPFALNIAYLLVLIGVGVGLIGSFMSVGKYLRWKR